MSPGPQRADPLDAADEIRRARYPGCEVVLLAGSTVRGESTPHSDLDLVVLFGRLEHAHRESFAWGGWPVEAFVHDPETLEHFFTQVDAPTGYIALPRMVAEGIELPASTELSRRCKRRAHQLIEQGPARLTEQEVRARRYSVTDLVDDLRAPRSAVELRAAAARLHDLLADCFLRFRGAWSARGKAIPRELRRADPVLAARYEEAFEAAFRRDDAGPVVRLAEEALAPVGGFLFEGYRLDAPADWRRGPRDDPGPDR